MLCSAEAPNRPAWRSRERAQTGGATACHSEKQQRHCTASHWRGKAGPSEGKAGIDVRRLGGEMQSGARQRFSRDPRCPGIAPNGTDALRMGLVLRRISYAKQGAAAAMPGAAGNGSGKAGTGGEWQRRRAATRGKEKRRRRWATLCTARARHGKGSNGMALRSWEMRGTAMARPRTARKGNGSAMPNSTRNSNGPKGCRGAIGKPPAEKRNGAATQGRARLRTATEQQGQTQPGTAAAKRRVARQRAAMDELGRAGTCVGKVRHRRERHWQ